VILDESTDAKVNKKLAMFEPYLSTRVIVKQEILDLKELKETTRDADVNKTLDTTLTNATVALNKIIRAVASEAPAMLGRNIGLVELLESDPRIR
jgi:hypothetical protein